MRVTDGIICSTDYLARRYRSFNERTWACYNGIDLKRYAWPKPAARGRDDRLGRRRRPQGLARALGAGDPRRAARPARGALRVRRPRRGRRLRRGVRPERAIGLPPGKIEVYPASMTLFDIAIAPVGREQPVPRQERPALARGERARHPARRAPGRLPRDRGRRHRRARAHAGRGRGGAAAARRRRASCASASAPRPTPTSPSTGASRSPPSAGATCCSKSAPVERAEKSFLQVRPWLPITSVSHGRRSRSHTGHPRPLHSAVRGTYGSLEGDPHIPHRGTDRDGRPL